jgi:glucosyl-dolichyl phosphate glucuronosyltransferase
MNREMMPLISIVLCTYNNVDSLAITLAQLANLQVSDPQLLEIIVVNNNSPDNTEAVVQTFIDKGQHNLSYFFEARQGLSFARNTGLEKATGEYILFTDDDAEISSHWVQEYINTINSYSPDCIYSKINIIWDKPKPWWFIPEYTPCFVGLDYGDQLLNVNDIHKEFYGKNFCVRKSILTELGGFDPKLGRQGTKLAAGEETLLYRKMIWAHKKVIYIPNASVGHRLKEREYSSENIMKLFVDGAFSSHHIAKLTAQKTILGRPARMIVDAVKNLAQSILFWAVYAAKSNRAKKYYYYLCIRRNLALISLWVAA